MIDGKQQFAESIVNLNKQSDVGYNQTFFGTVVKNCLDVSNTLTEEQQNKLDELKYGWYYIKLQDQLYKLQCENTYFELGKEVKVCVPRGDWNRIYIDFKQGTTFREWVRPSYWLPMPDVKDDEVWILTEGVGEMIIRVDFEDGGWLDLKYSLNANPNNNHEEASFPQNQITKYSNSQTLALHIKYTTKEQRWIKLQINRPHITSYELPYYTNQSITQPLTILEVLVGNDIAKQRTRVPFIFSRYKSVNYKEPPMATNVEHLRTPINTDYQDSFGYLWGCQCLEITKAPETLSFYSQYFSGDVFRVPENVKVINNNIFNQSNLKYVDFANTEDLAYHYGVLQYTESLTKVDMSKVHTIGDYAFAYCYNLREVNCPNTTRIHRAAFEYTENLEHFNIGNQPITLESNAFFCSGIPSIDHLNVKIIPNDCFYWCRNLRTIYNENVERIMYRGFAYCDWLTDVYIPNCTQIESNAFEHTQALRSLTVKKGCVGIENSGIDTRHVFVNYV